MPGTLYLVPTPIGNLGDLSPRAAEALSTADFLAVEDTRVTVKLLNHLGLKKPMVIYHRHNAEAAGPAILARLLAGESCALATDAGTPAISDPGFMLVRECRQAGVEVETLPGPTAFVPALVNSGLPCERFCFEGFLPPKKGRATRLAQLAADERTFIIYESPLRLVKTLRELAEVCGADRDASVSREISKLHNTTHNATLGELADYFSKNNPRGEIVIVVSGNRTSREERKVHRNKYRPDTSDGE